MERAEPKIPIEELPGFGLALMQHLGDHDGQEVYSSGVDQTSAGWAFLENYYG